MIQLLSLAFAAGWAGTGMAGFVALRLGLTSRVTKDRWGTRNIALGGGFGFIVPALALGLFLGLGETILFTAILVVLGAGAWDDARPIPPKMKLLLQVAAAVLLVVGGYAFRAGPPWLSTACSLFWILSMTNAFNLIDNMDGVAGSVAVAILVSIGLFAPAPPDLRLFSLLLAGSTAGFLRWNLFPARIYMGDAGSQALGLAVAALLTRYSALAPPRVGSVEYLMPGIVAGIPAFDVLLVIIARKLFGRAVSKGGKDHFSHRLVRMGCPEYAVAPALALASLILGLAAPGLSFAGRDQLIFAGGAVALAVVVTLVSVIPADPDYSFDNARSRRRYPFMGERNLKLEDVS